MSDLNYMIAGSGTPLVFQPGLTASIQQTEDLLGTLKGIRLMSIDCPGHGSSPLPEEYTPSFNHYADDVINFLDRQGIDRAIFGGISMGAGIAINIALRYSDRVKALILLRPAWLDQPNPENLQILLPAAQLRNEREGMEQFTQMKEFREIPLATIKQSILGIFDPKQQPGLTRTIEAMVGDKPIEEMGLLGSLNFPCLILGNDQDPLHPYAMAEKIHQSIHGSVLRKVTSRYIDNKLHSRQVRKNVREFIQQNNLH